MGSPLEGFSTEPVFILHGLWLGPGHPDTLARPLLPMAPRLFAGHVAGMCGPQ